MGWVKIDDAFFRHRKITGLTKDAKLLFIAGLTHSADQLTDGILTDSDVRLVAATADVKATARKELVGAGLWHELGHTCDSDKCQQQPPPRAVLIHDYLRYQPTAADERRRREQAQERTRKWRDGRRDTGRDANGDASHAPSGDADRMRSPSPSPSPSPKKPSTNGVGTLPPSSSSPRPDDDDGTQTLAETWTILAHRDLERRNAETSARGVEPITAPARQRAWLATAEHRCAEALQPIAQRFLASDPTLDPSQLADLLDNPIATALANSPLGGTR